MSVEATETTETGYTPEVIAQAKAIVDQMDPGVAAYILDYALNMGVPIPVPTDEVYEAALAGNQAFVDAATLTALKEVTETHPAEITAATLLFLIDTDPFSALEALLG